MSLIDLYTCTECGRCSDNCPAYNTEKKLSPKHVILAQRGGNLSSDPSQRLFMLTDGLKSENKEDEIGQWDILEVLSRAIEGDR